MSRWKCAGVIGFLASSAALAGGPGSMPTAAPAPVQLRHATHSLHRHEREVQRLQRAVAAQASRSRQADERLQQQDQAIVELRRQLHSLRSEPGAGQH